METPDEGNCISCGKWFTSKRIRNKGGQVRSYFRLCWDGKDFGVYCYSCFINIPTGGMENYGDRVVILLKGAAPPFDRTWRYPNEANLGTY